MDTSLGRALTRLPKGTLLPLPRSRGRGVAVFHGRAWVTQQNDPRDVLLGAGESFVLDRPGMAIVQALDDTSLLVFEVPPGPAPAVIDHEPAQSGLTDAYELHQQARKRRSAAIATALAGALGAAGAALVRGLRLLSTRWTQWWAQA